MVLRKERETYGEVEKVDKSPANFLGHAWYCIYDDFTRDDEDDMDKPCACEVIRMRWGRER